MVTVKRLLELLEDALPYVDNRPLAGEIMDALGKMGMNYGEAVS